MSGISDSKPGVSGSAKAGSLLSHPYLLLTLTTLFWGGNAVAGKIAAGSVPPLTLTALRWSGAAVLMYLLARPHLAAAMPTLRKRWAYIFACGAFGFGVFNCALYGALNFTSAINVTIEQSAIPVVIIAMTYVLYREPITAIQGLGVAISGFGVLVVATHGDLGALLRLEMNIGDAIMLIAIATYAGYSIALRHKPDLPWQVFMFGLALSAAIATLPLMALDFAAGRYPAATLVTPGVLAFVIVFPSLLSQVCYMRAVQMIGASRAGLFFNFVPVFGAGLAVLILGEAFRTYHAIGLVSVIGGIALAERSARRRAATG